MTKHGLGKPGTKDLNGYAKEIKVTSDAAKKVGKARLISDLILSETDVVDKSDYVLVNVQKVTQPEPPPPPPPPKP